MVRTQTRKGVTNCAVLAEFDSVADALHQSAYREPASDEPIDAPESR